MEGYRFYTTFNKGFSTTLTWIPDRGSPVTGTVNMPSYPMFEFKQSNSWTPPGGKEINFWLQLKTGLDDKAHWVLDARQARGTLVINSNDRRIELQPGENAVLDGGVLRYEHLSSWMGYKLFYDPTLQWLFITAIIGILGLATHFWRKFAALPIHSASGVKPDWSKGQGNVAVNSGAHVSAAVHKGQNNV